MQGLLPGHVLRALGKATAEMTQLQSDIAGGLTGIFIGMIIVGSWLHGYCQGYRNALEWSHQRIKELWSNDQDA